jgi:hypothetical protein
MKKLFFSAVALVAFSSVSMANTVNENKNENFVVKEQINSVNSLNESTGITPCQGVFSSVRLYAKNQGLSDSISTCIALAAYIECLGSDDASLVVKNGGVLC